MHDSLRLQICKHVHLLSQLPDDLLIRIHAGGDAGHVLGQNPGTACRTGNVRQRAFDGPEMPEIEPAISSMAPCSLSVRLLNASMERST